MNGLDLLGADAPAASALAANPYSSLYGGLAKFAGGLAEAAFDTQDRSSAEDTARANAAVKLRAVVDADAAATIAAAAAATANALVASAPNPKARQAAQQKADAASAAAGAAVATQQRAAAQLPPSAVEDRIAAAQSSFQAAQAKSTADPSSTYAMNLMKAWANTLMMAQGLAPPMPAGASVTVPLRSTMSSITPNTRLLLGGGGGAALGTGVAVLLRSSPLGLLLGALLGGTVGAGGAAFYNARQR